MMKNQIAKTVPLLLLLPIVLGMPGCGKADSETLDKNEILPPAPLANSTASSQQGDCDDSSVMCATLLTNKPEKALQRLAAALPAGGAKQFRVQVIVTPDGDDDSNDGPHIEGPFQQARPVVPTGKQHGLGKQTQ